MLAQPGWAEPAVTSRLRNKEKSLRDHPIGVDRPKVSRVVRGDVSRPASESTQIHAKRARSRIERVGISVEPECSSFDGDVAGGRPVRRDLGEAPGRACLTGRDAIFVNVMSRVDDHRHVNRASRARLCGAECRYLGAKRSADGGPCPRSSGGPAEVVDLLSRVDGPDIMCG